MQNRDKTTIQVYVELLDEGSEAWRPTQAQEIGKGLYKLLPTPNYDPEDEAWAFLPDEVVRVEQAQFADGATVMKAIHSNPEAVRIDVELETGSPFWAKRTHALNQGNGLYQVLPTPTYNPKNEKWKFPPGSIVRLKKIIFPDGFAYLMASEK